MLSFPAMPAKCQLRLHYLKLNAQELCRDESMRSCQILRLETHVVHSLRKGSPLAFDVGEHHSDNEFFRDECDTNRAQTLNGVSALKRTDLELWVASSTFAIPRQALLLLGVWRYAALSPFRLAYPVGSLRSSKDNSIHHRGFLTVRLGVLSYKVSSAWPLTFLQDTHNVSHRSSTQLHEFATTRILFSFSDICQQILCGLRGSLENSNPCALSDRSPSSPPASLPSNPPSPRKTSPDGSYR